MSEEVLRVEGLSVGIGVPAGTLRAVSDVDLQVGRGETLCIVGESGCGKTMTALGIMGLLPRRARLQALKVSRSKAANCWRCRKRRAGLRGNRMAMIFQGSR